MDSKNKTKKSETTKRLRIQDMDLKELVPVMNATYGKLVYKARDGFYASWDSFNDIVMLTVEELSKMRKEQPSFFQRQWIMIGGDSASEVINFLQVEDWLTDMPELDSFDDVFKLTPSKFVKYVSALSDTLKESVARRAYDLYTNGELDSVKLIDAVKKATGYSIQTVDENTNGDQL